MVWKDKNLEQLVQEAKKLLRTIISHDFNSEIFICSRLELELAITNELQGKISDKQFSQVKQSIDLIEGRYFKSTNQIWLVNDRGVSLDTIIHELLHTIQICSPNREGIIYFITYKLTHNNAHINSFLLRDWIEIEKIMALN